MSLPLSLLFCWEGNRLKKQILIVDDEQEMRELIKICLDPSYEMIEGSNGQEALQYLQEYHVSLVLLDIMMPEMSGLEVLKEMRKLGRLKNIPVILLTALGETEDVVKGLNLGADDYISKPFEPRELQARVASALRRSTEDHQSWNIHGLTIELEKYQVAYEGKVIPLTRKEFQLFTRLASHPGRVYSREQLVELEWDISYEGDTRNIDAHIKNIREKFKRAGYQKTLIETVWGIGYQFVEDKE